MRLIFWPISNREIEIENVTVADREQWNIYTYKTLFFSFRSLFFLFDSV